MDDRTLTEAVAEYPSQRAAARGLGIPEATLRRRLKKERDEGVAPDLPDFAFKPSDDHLPDTHVGPDGVETVDLSGDGTRRFILTSAQNNTRVHQGFLKNLEAFAAHMDARILCSFSVYDKAGYRGPVPKGERQTGKREVWWDRAILPYIVNDRVRLARRLAFCSELDVLATTQRPLSGLDAYCGRSSIIVPHNKFEFQCVPARKGHLPKEMHTTGSVTERNFIQRKTGQLASFHHVLGALLVEVRPDGHFHVHHLNADDDGSFYWLDHYVKNGTVYGGATISGLVVGDTHHEKQDDTVEQVTFHSADNIVSILKPDRMFFHDLIDFTSRNHHNRKDPEHQVYYDRLRDRDVASEVNNAGLFLRDVARKVPEVVVVPSNHHEAFRKWIHETDWREDVRNFDIYLAAARAMMNHAKTFGPSRRLDLLEWAIHDYCNIQMPPGVQFLEEDERYELHGIECGMHGHVGPSGSRGTPANLARLPFKTFTAHTHTPSIRNGCYTVGLSGSLDLGYNRGPSKWMHAHGIVYPNGKRAFVFLKNGKWRA
jgi:hypothetical protein